MIYVSWALTLHNYHTRWEKDWIQYRVTVSGHGTWMLYPGSFFGYGNRIRYLGTVSGDGIQVAYFLVPTHVHHDRPQLRSRFGYHINAGI